MFCPNCGNRYENEKFCSKCGTKLPAQGQSAQPGSQGQAAPPAGQSAGRNTSYAQQAAPGGYAQQNTQQRPAAGYGAPAGGAGFGQQRPQQPPVYRPQAPMGNPVGRKFREICSQTSFLVMAALFSISWIIGLFELDFDMGLIAVLNINILLLLGVIGLWVTYASAKGNASPFSSGGIKFISGTVFAARILIWVAVGLLAVLLVIFLVLADSAEDIMRWLYYDLPYGVGSLVRGGMLVYAIIILVAIAIMVVLNVTCYTYINNFTRSCYLSAESGRASFARVHATKCWLIALGVLSAISAIIAIWTNFVSFFSGAFMSAGYFAAYVWINKNFSVVPAPVGAQYQPQGGYRQMPPQYNNYQQAAPQYGYQPPRQSAAQGYQTPRQNMGYQAPQQNTGYQVTGQGAPQQNAGYQAYQQSAPRQETGYQVSGQSAPQQYTGYQQVQPQEPQQAAPEKPAEKVPAENPSDAAQESEDKD